MVRAIFKLILIIFCSLLLVIYSHSTPSKDISRSPAGIKKDTIGCIDLIENFISNKGLEIIRRFKAKNRFFSLIVPSENIEFIKLARNYNKSKQSHVFFHIENAFLKVLNDEIFLDKNLSHAVTNYYQMLFYREVLRNPKLSQKIVARYSDYKSLRIAFESISDDLDQELWQELGNIYQRVNRSFVQNMEKSLLKYQVEVGPRPAREIDRWFMPGIGRTPFEAATASRIARRKRPIANRLIVHFADHYRFLSEKLIAIEKTRQKIVDIFGGIRGILVRPYGGGRHLVLSVEVIDLIRKLDTSAPHQTLILKNHLKELFGSDHRLEHVQLLINYVSDVDTFSFPIYQKGVMHLDHSPSTHGIVSIDFTQKGAEGLYHTMGNVLRITEPDQAMTRVQRAFWVIDGQMNQSRKWFLRAMGSTGPPMDTTNFIHSGDDLLFFPDRILTTQDKVEIMRKMARKQRPAEYRIVFFPKNYLNSSTNILPDKSAFMIAKAEEIQKRLTLALKEKISVRETMKFTLAVDVVPQPDIIHYNLWVSSRNLQYKNIIEEEFRKTLRKMGLSEDSSIHFVKDEI